MPPQINSDSESANRSSFLEALGGLEPGDFRKHVKRVMRMTGTLQKDVIAKVGASQPSVSEYLAGKRNGKINESTEMEPHRMLALAKYMDELAESVRYAIVPVSSVSGIERREQQGELEEVEEEEPSGSHPEKEPWTQPLIEDVLKRIEDPVEREAYGKFLRKLDPKDLTLVFMAFSRAESGPATKNGES